MVDEQKKPELKKSEQTPEEKEFERKQAEQDKVEEKQREETAKALQEQYEWDAVRKGLELKKIRDEEDALIKLAEEYLAKQEKEAKNS